MALSKWLSSLVLTDSWLLSPSSSTNPHFNFGVDHPKRQFVLHRHHRRHCHHLVHVFGLQLCRVPNFLTHVFFAIPQVLVWLFDSVVIQISFYVGLTMVTTTIAHWGWQKLETEQEQGKHKSTLVLTSSNFSHSPFILITKSEGFLIFLSRGFCLWSLKKFSSSLKVVPLSLKKGSWVKYSRLQNDQSHCLQNKSLSACHATICKLPLSKALKGRQHFLSSHKISLHSQPLLQIERKWLKSRGAWWRRTREFVEGPWFYTLVLGIEASSSCGAVFFSYDWNHWDCKTNPEQQPCTKTSCNQQEMLFMSSRRWWGGCDKRLCLLS